MPIVTGANPERNAPVPVGKLPGLDIPDRDHSGWDIRAGLGMRGPLMWVLRKFPAQARP